ncbi:helix-turn-helix domain-containing protein [Actinotignum schaalii]|uniref:helix-turn-helix domain-containing protein n=1 Tax=Actinotignum TaxID=1653174 RepID=UPI00237E7AE7|nr:helix-turn-helix transcriptional regulator [Actinotignum sanguinis]MDE1552254.1 helix-turn-helix transcriptional regulator [Actinotignum sanguinis]
MNKRGGKKLKPVDAAAVNLLAAAVAGSGRTHKEIAEEIGISQNRVSTILRGDTPPATLGEIYAIAEAAGADGSTIVVKACETRTPAPSPDDYAVAALDYGVDPEAEAEGMWE